MIIPSIRAVICRELRALVRELEAFPDEESIWSTPVGVQNSTGTLALHLAGNLRHFVGAQLGGTDYQRDRPREFHQRQVPRRELIAEIERAQAEVESSLLQLSEDRLAAPFPDEFAGALVRTDEFLIHLASHLAFHLGQIDYHRRMVTGEKTTIGPLAMAELSTYRQQD